jgi:hypothetical protein
MSRSAYRLVSFVLLISTLMGIMPLTEAVPLVTASTPTAPSMVEATDPPSIPPPQNATSDYKDASYVTTNVRPQYQATHTLNNFFDGSFSNEEVTTLTTGTTYTATPGNPAYIDLPVGTRDHDFMTFDVSIKGRTFLAQGTVALEEVVEGGGGIATDARDVITLDGNAAEKIRSQVRLSLGVVPRGTPLRVKLSCENKKPISSGTVTCKWFNIRVTNAVPDWIRVADPFSSKDVTTPYEGLLVAVRSPGRSRLAAAAPKDAAIFQPTSSFLEFETNGARDGGPNNDQIFLRSQMVQLPTFTTGELTATVRWARLIRDATPQLGTSGATIQFRALKLESQDETFATDLITIPDGDMSISTGWSEKKDNPPFPTTLSGQRGWFEIVKKLGGTDHIMGLDDLIVYRNGKPLSLAIPDDQVIGVCDTALVAPVQCYEGDPVNTHSGSFYLPAVDLHVPTVGLPLTLSRTYVSLFADPTRYPTTPLGPGWRHSFDGRLTLPTSSLPPGGEAKTVIYESPTGNRLRFYIDPFSRRLSPRQTEGRSLPLDVA